MSGMKDQLGDTPFYLPYNGQLPSQAHSPTSIAAAESIRPLKSVLHQRILTYLGQHSSGATDEDMQSDLDMPANTQRPRRRELQLSGQIKDSGRVKKTRSGRSATVWVIV